MAARSEKTKKIFEKIKNVSTNHFFLIKAMDSGNTVGPSAYLQVKTDCREKLKSERKYKVSYGKNKIFSTAAILFRGVKETRRRSS
jgi:hypothetical protein